MNKRRVVVTGLGMLTPLGVDVATSWQGLKEGKSGISAISSFDTQGYPVRFGGTVPAFDMGAYFPPKEARRMDGFIQYGLVAGIQAVQDAHLEVTEQNRQRIGVAIGSGIGGIATISDCHEIITRRGPTRVSPFFVPSSIINMIAGHLSIRFGMEGPNIAISTACTTGAHNIGMAARLIAWGDADVMLAGGAEKAIAPTTMAGFAAMKALSTRNDSPAEASRPWDRDRDGFVLSDAAAVLVLEEYEAARSRGARIYCELAGFGMSADASHMTSPAEQGTGAVQAMRLALEDGAMNVTEIDYINAHSTSTSLGDLAETQAIKTLLGDSAKEVAVSSNKSMVGHALGAAGAIEAVFTILALEEQVAPPTINLQQADVGCDLDYVPHQARDMRIEAALTNSFGFGGTNGSLIFRRLT